MFKQPQPDAFRPGFGAFRQRYHDALGRIIDSDPRRSDLSAYGPAIMQILSATPILDLGQVSARPPI